MKSQNINDQSGAFSRFSLLPRELRLRIWEFACPEISADATLSLDFDVTVLSSSRRYHTVRPGSYLHSTVREIRIMSAVHRESRAMVMKALPDTLSFRAWHRSKVEGGVVRFRKERDIVCINRFASLVGHVDKTAPVEYHLTDFADRVENVAVMDRHVCKKDRRCLLFLSMLTSLKRIYYCQMVSVHSPNNIKDWQWAASNICTLRSIGYIGYDAKMYSWPKAANEAGLGDITKVSDHCGPALLRAAQRHGWELVPMAKFQGQRGFKTFDMLAAGEIPNSETPIGGNAEDEEGFSDTSSYRSFTSGSTSDWSKSGAIRTAWWVGLVKWADTPRPEGQASEAYWLEWAEWAKEAAEEEELEERLEIQRMAELQARWRARMEEHRRLLPEQEEADGDQERRTERA